MKGLLMKDFQLLKSQKQSYIPGLVIGLIFVFFNNTTFATTYLTIILSTITYSTINFDQYGNSMGYLMTLPVSRNSYVKEKYLLQILVTALSVIIAALVTSAGFFIKHAAFRNDTLAAALLTAFITSVLLQSVMIPLLLKFGAEKSRITIAVILGMVYVLGFLCYVLIQKLNLDLSAVTRRISTANTTVAAGCACAAMAVLMGISFLVSLHIMKKKEF